MDTTLFQKPQINIALSTPGRMYMVCACAFLAIFQSSLSDNGHSLFIAFAAIAGTLITELIFNLKERYYTIKDGSALASALILTLLLPNTLNPLYAFWGGVFAMAVLKHSFGGLGSNWINPAAGAWLFIRSAWPDTFAHSIEKESLVRLSASVEGGLRDSLGSPMTLLKINGWPSSSFDGDIITALNRFIFSATGTPLPQGYLNFFSPGRGFGIIADQGLLFLLLGIILITAWQTFRVWLPLVFLLVYSLLVRIFGALPFGGAIGQGDILFALLSGGTLAGAFMLITDPATGPKSAPGYLVFICITAIFTFIFRYPGLNPYGIIPAVLLGNALVPLIRRIENAFFYERKRADKRSI